MTPEGQYQPKFIGGAILGVAIGSSYGLESTMIGAAIGGATGEIISRLITHYSNSRGRNRVINSTPARLD